MDPETFLFRRFLYQISNSLSQSEVSSLRFMLDNALPRRQLEDAMSGFDIFCLMEEKNFLTPNNLQFLQEVLETVRKSHLVEQYRALKGSTSSSAVIKPIPGPGVNPTEAGQGQNSFISSHKKLLGDLGGQLSAEDVHDMALFFHGGSSSIHVKDLEKLKSAESVFKKLEGSRTIRPGDYTILYNVLDVIGRLDLCELIADHCNSQAQASNLSSPIAAQASNLSSPIAAQGEPQIRYPHQPSLYGPSLGSSYSSEFSSSSMESRDGVRSGPSMVVAPGIARPQGSLPSEPNMIDQLESDKQNLQKQLALAMKQVQVEQDQALQVQLLEEQLKKKITEVEQLRKTAHHLSGAVGRPPSYEMNRNPHGIAVVFVNKKFDKNLCDPDLELSVRMGADKDRALLAETFRALSYEVRIFKNLTAEKMYTEIERAMQESDNSDSFVCCVSTHGNATGVFGSDSVILKWDEIQALATQSVPLRGKPKLFFFQSCRRPPIVKADGSHSSHGHEDADIYKVYACTPNSEAFSSPEYGSWLALSMKRYFTNPQLMHTYSLDVLTRYVCTEVSEQVGVLVENGQELEVQQCVHSETTLKKSVYFFPEQI